MGKLSTGQNFGEVVGAEDSARLLGGVAEIAPAGVIGNAQLPTAPVRPAATQVNTFQPSGAPTLGGKQFVFDRPKLPESNKDATRLAQSLSAFNSNLGLIAQDFEQAEKLDIAADKKAGIEAAAELSKASKLLPTGYQSITDAIAKVEELSKTDPSQLPLLHTLKNSQSGRRLRFANEAFSESNLQISLANVNGEIAKTKKLPSGRSIETVAENDPEFLSFATSLMTPQGTTNQSIATNSQQINAQWGVVLQQQRKRFADFNDGVARNGATRGSEGVVVGVLKGTESVQTGGAKITGYLDQLKQIGSPDLYRDFVQKLPALLTNMAKGAIKGGTPGEQDTAGKVIGVLLQNIGAGPNRAPILNQIEGGALATLLAVSQEMTKGANERQAELDQAEEREVRAVAKNVIKAAFANIDPNNPAAMKKQIEAIDAKGLSMYGSDPRKLGLYTRETNAYRDGLTRTSSVVQEENFIERLSKSSTGSQAEIDQYKTDVIRGVITPTQGNQLITRAQIARKEENQIPLKEAAVSRRAIAKRLEDISKVTGETGVTVAEENANKAKLRTFDREVERIIATSDPDKVEQIDAAAKKFTDALQAPANKKQREPSYLDIKDAARQVGTRSKPLQAAMNSPKPLYSRAQFKEDLENYNENKVPRPEFKTLTDYFMRTNKMTPQQFLEKQAEKHGITAAPGFQLVLPDTAPAAPAAPAVPAVPAARQQQQRQSNNPQAGGFGMTGTGTAARTERRLADLKRVYEQIFNQGPTNNLNAPTSPTTMTGTTGSNSLAQVIRDLKGAESFRGTKQIRFKQRGDYQSSADENFFFDFNPSLVPLALKRAAKLSQNDINALAFTALTEAGPTAKGKLEVVANLINRSAAKSNAPIVDIAKAPGQYEGVFGYSKAQVISQAEGQRLFGSRYTQLRTQLMGGN